MKIHRHLASGLLAAAVALASSAPTQAQTIITNTFTFSFASGGASSAFNSTWIYWYNSPGGNAPILEDPTQDASNNPASGSLEVISPLAGSTQDVFFGTFASNVNNGYDFSVEANLVLYTNISFDIMVASNTPLSSSGNYGSIGVGVINSSYGYQQFSSVTIPATASNHWVHLVVPIDQTQNNLATIPGLAFAINSYGGYPNFTFTNWMDNISANSSPAPPPPPPTVFAPQIPTAGLTCIAVTPGQPNNRYQLATTNDPGYSFVGQSSVTYSWTIKSFPTNTLATFQQHFFIVNGAPGTYDQAADYNLADCIFITVQQVSNGTAVCNFRYKTNEPGGNGMIFNTLSLTNAANTNLWPVEPVASLTNAPILGTWSLTFSHNTNVTITAPNGTTTNFIFDAASAALFADPCTLLLGAQPNSTNFYGDAVVYSNFSVAGNQAPFTDNFVADTAINTNYWFNLSSDTNGAVIVPSNALCWVAWSRPSPGYQLQGTTNLGTNAQWVSLASDLTILNNGKIDALVLSNDFPGAKAVYFDVVQRQFSQLQVLLPGETNAPNSATGRVGTPTPVSASVSEGAYTFTVLAVDAHWNPVPSSSDSIAITSTDGASALPNNASLVNGSKQFTIFFSLPEQPRLHLD